MSNDLTAAALYVDPEGPYFGRENVDPWGEERDARTYAGPHPVVAHPPCKRWGRYWSGGPSAKVRREMGDDEGCFAAAFAAVQKYGGVLEHPEASHAWNAFGISKPPKSGGWRRAGLFTPGWTCCVEQGHYGHPARKATWLYVVGTDDLPKLIWGRARGKQRLDTGFHSVAERDEAALDGTVNDARIASDACRLTPPAFAGVLLDLARRTERP